MKKFLIGFIILAVLIIGIFFLLQRDAETGVEGDVVEFPEPAPGAIVFDMKYRGLSGGKDELSYNSYWGFGSRGNETRFIKELKKDIKELHTVYHPNFGKAQYSAIEVENKKAVALYFDLNADEKFSDNEKILPILAEKSGYTRGSDFVMPDFIVNTSEGKQVPFRALLRVNFYGDSSRPNCMWSPSCVLEGTSTINGKPIKLILYTSHDFSVSFNKYGRCSYSLFTEAEEKYGSYLPRQTLSSIINHDGQFYYLKLYGSHEKDKSIRAMLEKYTGSTGELAIGFSGKSKLNSKPNNMNIIGSKDTTIQFNVPSGQAELPTGAYKLNRSYVDYGKEKDDEWQLDFTEGPEFTIKADKTSNVELGEPVLSISAVDENKRYQRDVKEQTIYSKGTNIFISRIIKGKAGELYGKFSERDENNDRLKPIEPDIRIVDADGKEVAAAKIKYG
jgi:hypothetical protein